MLTGSFTFGNAFYTANTSGAVTEEKTVTDGWVLSSGEYYYYKDGLPYTGWTGDYYIRDGIMLRNQAVDGYWIGNDGKYIKTAGWYKVRSAGGSGETASVIENWVYINSDRKAVCDGWQKINNVWYYFDHYIMRTAPLTEGGSVYYFSDSGKLLKTVGNTSGSMWVNTGEYWGYIKNGAAVLNGIYIINGKEYAFVEGRMITDQVYSQYKNYGTTARYYQSDGAAFTGFGWKKINSQWFYFTRSGAALLNSWVKDNGKQYYLGTDGGMLTGWQVIDGTPYNFGTDGALADEVVIHENGWLQKGSDWLYFKTGIPVVSGVRTINGTVYGFINGRLGRNELIIFDGLYYADENGVIVRNAWKKINNIWYWFGNEGRAVDGVHSVNGVDYYFTGYQLQ